jgi:hypothetical protein
MQVLLDTRMEGAAEGMCFGLQSERKMMDVLAPPEAVTAHFFSSYPRAKYTSLQQIQFFF